MQRVSLQAFRQARPFLGEGSGAFCLLFTLSSSLLEPPKNVSYLNIPITEHSLPIKSLEGAEFQTLNRSLIRQQQQRGVNAFFPSCSSARRISRVNVINIQMLTINIAALLSYSILIYLNQNRRTPAPPRTPRGLYRRCPES